MTSSSILRAPRGFTMVEAIMCTVIVGVMFVAAMQAVSASATIQFKAADRARGRTLANALLGEIVQQNYSSTSTSRSGGLLGVLVGGLLGGGGNVAPAPTNRMGFDDIDDYSGYSDAPPLNRDGTAIANASAYRRRVIVSKINPVTLATTTSETGCKLVTVEVTRNGAVVERVSTVRTDTP